MDSESTSVALLAIKPRFAAAILAGHKKVEFRKTRFTLPPRYVVLYASTPIQQVVAFFEVVEIEERTITGLWRKFRKSGGINYQEFLNYYGDRDSGLAIVVGSVWKVGRPTPLRFLYEHGAVPQSFRYLPAESLDRLKRQEISLHIKYRNRYSAASSGSPSSFR